MPLRKIAARCFSLPGFFLIFRSQTIFDDLHQMISMKLRFGKNLATLLTINGGLYYLPRFNSSKKSCK